MRKINNIYIIFILAMFVSNVSLAQSPATFQKISQSIVKIEAGNSSGTGFIWQDKAHVVTSLHVVDQADKIVVRYINKDGLNVATTTATIKAILKSSDLVLLHLANPEDRPPLQVNPVPPIVKQTFDVIGFPLNIQQASSTEVKIRFGGKTLETILPPKALKTLGDYPSINTEILNLEGNLVPGHSGSPIIDASGSVIGIADGGIADGAVGIVWGIPANRLQLLAQSSNSTLPKSASAKILFAADLTNDVGETFTFGSTRFTKLRSRTYEQLISTADDRLGLDQLTALFSNLEPETFQYDVYQDQDSGATIVIPKDARLISNDDFIRVDTGDERMFMKLQLSKLSSPNFLQLKSALFEYQLLEANNSMSATPDPAWSLLQPFYKFGVVVNRKAWYRNKLSNGNFLPDKYFFETLASDGNFFLGVAAVNNDNTVPTVQKETQCGQSGQTTECAMLLKSRKIWAQMVIGVQLSSFPSRNL